MLFVMPLTLKAKVYFNVKNNSGKIELKFVSIKILSYNFRFFDGCLELTKANGKRKYLPLKIDKQSIEVYTNVQDIIFRKIYLKHIGIYFNFGIDGNPFLSSMVVGYFDVLSKILYAVLKTQKSEVQMTSKCFPNFESTVIKIGIKAKISLSVYDMIWSFVEAKFIKAKPWQKEIEKCKTTQKYKI